MSERIKKIFDDESSEVYIGIEDYNFFITNTSVEVKLYNAYLKVFLVLIYALVFLLSMFGNSLILSIIYRTKRMRTVNNYFLANLLVSNLIYTVCAPIPFLIEINEKNGEWVFHDILCPIIPLMSTISINLNTFTMIVSAIERLIVIIYPFKTKLSKKSCLLLISLIWVFAIFLALPWSFLIRIHPNHDSIVNMVKICIPNTHDDQLIRVYFTSLCILQYILPLIVLVITYTIIIYYINVVNAKNIEKDANKSNNFLRKKNENKLIKMQILMIICFNICWLPLQVNALVFSLDPSFYVHLISPKTSKYVWMGSHLLAFSHFCLNPILTGILNKKFRVEILCLLKMKSRNLITSTTQNNLTNLANKYKRNLIKSNDFIVKTSKFKARITTTNISESNNDTSSKYRIVSLPIIFLHKDIESANSLFKLKSYDDIALSIFDDCNEIICNDSNTNSHFNKKQYL